VWVRAAGTKSHSPSALQQREHLTGSDTDTVYLWKDDQFPLEERTAYVDEVKDIVFDLKNSVAKHDPRSEYWAIRYRIERTREKLEQLAEELAEMRGVIRSYQRPTLEKFETAQNNYWSTGRRNR